MSSFAFLSNNAFLKASGGIAATPYAVAGIAWDGSGDQPPRRTFRSAGDPRGQPHAVRRHPSAVRRAPDGLFGDVGDLPLPNTSLRAMREAMRPHVERLIRAHHMVWLGGDHSITLPLLRAYRDLLGRPLAVIHFDAHCDTWQDHFGEPSGHGTWVYEAMQEGLVVRECFTQTRHPLGRACATRASTCATKAG